MGLGGGEAEPAAALEKMWSLPYSPTLLPPGLQPHCLWSAGKTLKMTRKRFNVMNGVLEVW